MTLPITTTVTAATPPVTPARRPAGRSVGLATVVAAGAVAFGVGDLLRRLVDVGADSPVELASAVTAHRGLWLAAACCALLGAALLVPGLLAFPGRVAGRGSMLVRAGSGLFALGLLGSVGHTVAYFGLAGIYADADVDAATLKTLDSASESSPLLLGLIVVFVLGLVVGQLLLVVGLRRAALVPLWAVAAALVDIAAGNSGGVPAGVVGLLGWAAVGALLARAVVRES
jgi:hypothetical protein